MTGQPSRHPRRREVCSVATTSWRAATPTAGARYRDRGLAVLAGCAGVREARQRSGFGPAMARFIALASRAGLIPPGFAGQPAPDPAAFGLPARDDGARDDPLLGVRMTACIGHQHDLGALRAAPTLSWAPEPSPAR